MGVRHSIPERCNKNAWYIVPENGMRLCLEHRPVLWPDDKEWESLAANMVGPCDYPMDGLGTARYERARGGLAP